MGDFEAVEPIGGFLDRGQAEAVHFGEGLEQVAGAASAEVREDRPEVADEAADGAGKAGFGDRAGEGGPSVRPVAVVRGEEIAERRHREGLLGNPIGGIGEPAEQSGGGDAERVVLGRFAAAFLDHIEIRAAEVFGHFADAVIAAQEHAAGQLAFADAEFLEDLRESGESCIAIFEHLDAGFTAAVGAVDVRSGHMGVPLPLVADRTEQGAQGRGVAADLIDQFEHLRARAP